MSSIQSSLHQLLLFSSQNTSTRDLTSVSNHLCSSSCTWINSGFLFSCQTSSYIHECGWDSCRNRIPLPGGTFQCELTKQVLHPQLPLSIPPTLSLSEGDIKEEVPKTLMELLVPNFVRFSFSSSSSSSSFSFGGKDQNDGAYGSTSKVLSISDSSSLLTPSNKRSLPPLHESSFQGPKRNVSELYSIHINQRPKVSKLNSSSPILQVTLPSSHMHLDISSPVPVKPLGRSQSFSVQSSPKIRKLINLHELTSPSLLVIPSPSSSPLSSFFLPPISSRSTSDGSMEDVSPSASVPLSSPSELSSFHSFQFPTLPSPSNRRIIIPALKNRSTTPSPTLSNISHTRLIDKNSS